MIIDTISKFLKLDGLIESITGYVEARIELLKIEIKEDVSKTIASALIFALIGIGLVLFIFFISFAVAVKLGEYVSTFQGFAIVAGFYLLLALLTFLFRKLLIKKIEEHVLSSIKSKEK